MLGYSLSSSSAATGIDPKAWMLQGSKDGVSWSLIDRRTTETFDSRYLRKNYDRSNSNTYNYFKLTISEVSDKLKK